MTDPLIPLEIFFGNPDRTQLRISPDGRWFSYLAPDEGVLNLWVAPVDALEEAEPITRDRESGIRAHAWLPGAGRIVYPQDRGGNEQWHVYAVAPDGGEPVDLTPLEEVSAQILGTSRRHPHRVVVGINDRDRQLHDPWSIDLESGERRRLDENPGLSGYVLDRGLRVRFGVRQTPEGGLDILRRTGDGWEEYQTVPPGDALTTVVIGFADDDRTAYLLDSRGRDTAALFAVDVDTGERRLLAEDDRADLSEVITDPDTGQPVAVAVTYLRREVRALDAGFGQEFDRIASRLSGDVTIVSRTLDDGTWVVAETTDDGPVRYHLHRRGGATEYLFSSQPVLDELPLAPLRPVVIRSRDGLDLVSYLTVPRWLGEDPAEPQPLVLSVHGGPWARDAWGYDPFHQWLANRGYAVLGVNFRGSTGFGKGFLNAGDREWGRKMHEDLLDAVDWAVGQGIAAPDRVAIMGGSYGGYATLAGLAFTPDVFACGVDIVGPSNLETLLDSIPPYWEPMRRLLETRVGDPTTPEGKQLLVERSPLSRAGDIRRPLLIGQGANDPRVKRAESDQIVAALQQKGIPVTYVLFPDEGHGFARPENRLAFFAVTEAFLARHLGGRAEPPPGDFPGSSIQILEPGGLEVGPPPGN